jgi:hypothetical protein
MLERAFEAIRKNERDYKETLKRYNFRKPRREANPSEQVGPISISNFEESCEKMICNKNNKCHYIKRNLFRNRFQKMSKFPTRRT